MKVTQIIAKSSERYPWTHRIEFDKDTFPVYNWTSNEDIPGLWINEAFYTTAKYVTIISLKWGYL
jgi:hypothetical protein